MLTSLKLKITKGLLSNKSEPEEFKIEAIKQAEESGHSESNTTKRPGAFLPTP